MNKKPLVLVVCGAGTLTSVMAAQGIEEGLRKKGIKGANIKVSKLQDVGQYSDIKVLVTSMNVRGAKYDFPVINGISFVIGDEGGQQKVINQVAEILSAAA